MRREFAAVEISFDESQAAISVVLGNESGRCSIRFCCRIGEASVIFELVAYLVTGPLFPLGRLQQARRSGRRC